MNAKKILFPSDFSTHSQEALQYAATLAEDRGATLLIMHVEEPPIVYGEGAYYYGVELPDLEAVREMLHGIRPVDSPVAYEHRLVKGDPAEEIVAMAKRERVELIVMSSHGRTGLARLVMGSVAEQVVRRAECPVLIYKPTVKTAPPAAAGRPQ